MFHKSLNVNCFKLSQLAIKTMQSHYCPLCTCQLFFFWLSVGSFWLQVRVKTAKKWHKKYIFPILIILTHIQIIFNSSCDLQKILQRIIHDLWHTFACFSRAIPPKKHGIICPLMSPNAKKVSVPSPSITPIVWLLSQIAETISLDWSDRHSQVKLKFA